MNGRLLDKNNDIFLDPVTNRVVRCSSLKDRVKRRIKTVLHTFEGECFTDFGVGVPWIRGVLGLDYFAADTIKAIIREKIEQIQGVKEVLEISLELKDRNMSGKIQVQLDDGTTLKEEIGN